MTSHVAPQSVFADEHFATHRAWYLRWFVNFSHVRHITLKITPTISMSKDQTKIDNGKFNAGITMVT